MINKVIVVYNSTPQNGNLTSPELAIEHLNFLFVQVAKLYYYQSILSQQPVFIKYIL